VTELQEFWEWCGFKDNYESSGFWWGLSPEGRLTALTLDLDFLFKYAVPRLKEVNIEIDLSFAEDTVGRMCEVTLTHFPIEHSIFESELYYARDYNPAQALYKAIQKVMK